MEGDTPVVGRDERERDTIELRTEDVLDADREEEVDAAAEAE